MQEAFLRLHRALQEGERIESPRAYRPTVVTRLCIDQLRSARVRRESYVGEWLPEPLVAARTTTRRATRRWPTRCRSRSSCCSRASRPSSARRSCCARSSTTPTTRSPRSSARARTTPASWRRGPGGTWRSAGRASRLARAARRAGARASSRPSQEGDLGALERLLAEDVVLHGDGGGKVPALGPRAARPGARRAHAARAGQGVAARFGGVQMRRVEVNGQPGAVRARSGRRGCSTSWRSTSPRGGSRPCSSVVNPDKLRPPRPAGRHPGAARAPELTPARGPLARAGGPRRGAGPGARRRSAAPSPVVLRHPAVIGAHDLRRRRVDRGPFGRSVRELGMASHAELLERGLAGAVRPHSGAWWGGRGRRCQGRGRRGRHAGPAARRGRWAYRWRVSDQS